jgi:hypothetical protein
MELIFRSLPAGEMERPPTQRDQFDNDDVQLVDALVRESIQNSLDANDKAASKSVRVCFNIKEFGAGELAEVHELIDVATLNTHLALSEMPTLDVNAPMRVLTVEDFGTSGLTGSWSDWDDSPFCDFWRRMGRSHKGGQSLGRWGLGKLVFSSASSARIFLGLTVRKNDAESLLMGQAVLTHHKMPDGARKDSHGFYAAQGTLHGEPFQIPERNPEIVEKFKVVFGLKRATEPGLSVVVPALRDSIKIERIAQGVLRNYFCPILFGRLEVHVGDIVINDSSFAELAGSLDAERFAGGQLAEFIQTMKATRDKDVPVPFTLPVDWAKKHMDEALGEHLEVARERLNKGEVVMVRAPLLMKQKDGKELPSFVDAFLQRAPSDVQPMFVRHAIVLNAEHKYFRGRKVMAALIADDNPVSAFLGDAENPAHTGWSASAEKVVSKWRNPTERLKEIRHLLTWLHNSLVSAVETLDKNALVSVFSVPSEDGSQATHPKGKEAKPPVIPPIPAKPRSFKITHLPTGFKIQEGLIEEADLPIIIRIRVAYDVMRGNPFKKHNPVDFDFGKKGLEIQSLGAVVTSDGANALRIEVKNVRFVVNVQGFDPNRDLIVDPEKVS